MDKKIVSITVFTDGEIYGVSMWNADDTVIGTCNGRIYDNLWDTLCDIGNYCGFNMYDVSIWLNYQQVDFAHYGHCIDCLLY